MPLLTAEPKLLSEPFFLTSGTKQLFAVYHRPNATGSLKASVLFISPFNEEMNRSRSMMTMQAQALAKQGYGTLILDLYGTGDSAGEHSDARWQIWLDNLRDAQIWLSRQPGGLTAILGFRLGAILAAQTHAQLGLSSVRLIFWQPVLDGKIHLTQFLRVRMAAQLDRPDLPKETTATMRAELAHGKSIEVAGYEIHPELAEALDRGMLRDSLKLADTKVLWLENASADKPELSAASQTLVASLTGFGLKVEAQTFTGAAFWQLHERASAPELITATTRWIVNGSTRNE